MATPSNKRSRAQTETGRRGRRISHVVGFDDAPFERSHRGDVLVVRMHGDGARFLLFRKPHHPTLSVSCEAKPMPQAALSMKSTWIAS